MIIKTKRAKRGFSIMEVMISVSIIMILSGHVAFGVSESIAAKERIDKAKLLEEAADAVVITSLETKLEENVGFRSLFPENKLIDLKSNMAPSDQARVYDFFDAFPDKSFESFTKIRSKIKSGRGIALSTTSNPSDMKGFNLSIYSSRDLIALTTLDKDSPDVKTLVQTAAAYERTHRKRYAPDKVLILRDN